MAVFVEESDNSHESEKFDILEISECRKTIKARGCTVTI
jgi:hypothetical protein